MAEETQAAAFAARLCRLAEDVVCATEVAKKDDAAIQKWEAENRETKANQPASDSFSSFLIHYDGLRASSALAAADDEEQGFLCEVVWSMALPSIFRALRAQNFRAVPHTVVHLLSSASQQVLAASAALKAGSTFQLEWHSGSSIVIQLSRDFFTPPEQHQIAMGFAAQLRTPEPRGYRFYPTSLEVCILAMLCDSLEREVASSKCSDYGIRPKRIISMVSDTLKIVSDILYPSTSSDDPDFSSDSEDDDNDDGGNEEGSSSLPETLPLRPLILSVVQSSSSLLSLIRSSLVCSPADDGSLHGSHIRLFGLLSRSIGRDVQKSFSPRRPAFDGVGGVRDFEEHVVAAIRQLELDNVLKHPARVAYRKRMMKSGGDEYDEDSDGSHYASSEEDEGGESDSQGEGEVGEGGDDKTDLAGRLSSLPFTSSPRWCPVGVAAVAHYVFMSRKAEEGMGWFPSVLSHNATWNCFWPHVAELLLAGESYAASPEKDDRGCARGGGDGSETPLAQVAQHQLPPATTMGFSLATELLAFVPAVCTPTSDVLGTCQLLLNAAAKFRSTKAVDIVREAVRKVESENGRVAILGALLRSCPNPSLLPLLLNIANKAAISDDEKIAFSVPFVEDMLSCKTAKEVDDARLVKQREVFIEALFGIIRGVGRVERLRELHPKLLERCHDFAKEISTSAEWQLGLLQLAFSELPPA